MGFWRARNVLLVIMIASLAAIPISLAHAEREIHVPADYATIQDAVNGASPGDTIVISPGTFTEQVLVAKSLQIRGSDGTIIKAPSTLSPDSFGARNIIDITGGATVKISGLTIEGPGPTGCGSITAGIFVSGDASLKIRHSTVADIRDNPAGGCQNGVGIFVGRHLYGTTGHAEIHDVKIMRFQKGGIVVDNSGSTAEIRDNQIVWGLSPLDIASNGIQISRGATASVEENTVSGNICSAPSCGTDLLNNDQSTGILLFQNGDATSVGENRISNNDIGIAAYQSPPSVKIDENGISMSNNVAGITLQDGNYTISENRISGSGHVGVAAIADSANTVATLDDNRIKDISMPTETLSVSPYTATVVVK